MSDDTTEEPPVNNVLSIVPGKDKDDKDEAVPNLIATITYSNGDEAIITFNHLEYSQELPGVVSFFIKNSPTTMQLVSLVNMFEVPHVSILSAD